MKTLATPLPLPEVLPVIEIPDLTVDKSQLEHNRKVSMWSLEGQPFSGYAVRYYPNNTLRERLSFFEGKKQNEALIWYPDGHLKNSKHYHQGKLHGEQRKWYATGELFKVLQVDMGKESGIQQAFRKNGELFANYEARAGRIFGLKRAALCYELENEMLLVDN